MILRQGALGGPPHGQHQLHKELFRQVSHHKGQDRRLDLELHISRQGQPSLSLDAPPWH